MRALLILALVAVASCDRATGPELDLAGDWYLSATAGAACQMLAEIHLSRAADGFAGDAKVGFSRQTNAGEASWGGEGFPVRAEYMRVQIVGYDLAADHWSAEAGSGSWTCDGTAGTWTWVRERD